MKKSLILALAAAVMPAMAGTPVVIPAAPAPAPCPMSFEVGVGYSWAGKDLIDVAGPSKEIDTVGLDVTGIYALDDNWSANLRLGYAFGDEVEKRYGDKWETDMHVFTLMPGVRYTMPINDTISAYAGANIGLAIVSVKDHQRGENVGGSYAESGHGSEAGFAYSAEIGIQHAISETMSAFVAWQVAGNTATPDVTYSDGYYETNKQVTTGIRAGVNIKF